jgi:hypothetical protein
MFLFLFPVFLLPSFKEEKRDDFSPFKSRAGVGVVEGRGTLRK